MPLITYVFKHFRDKSYDDIDRANHVLNEYAEQGYTLTLRQLYYQFVARGWRENTERSYKRLGDLISNARLAGHIDWYHLVDRTHNLRGLPHWSGPDDIIGACAKEYRVDHWEGQPARVEVWVEKDALIDVVAKACDPLDVPFFSCRGYTSQSEMWAASQRLIEHAAHGQEPVILHLGDHDPSGMDMSRDIQDRLGLFCGYAGVEVTFARLALNMDQIQEHEPPPNPTKVTDARAAGYIDRFGHECWELDALEPRVLTKLVAHHIRKQMKQGLFKQAEERTMQGRRVIQELANEADMRERGIPLEWRCNDVY